MNAIADAAPATVATAADPDDACPFGDYGSVSRRLVAFAVVTAAALLSGCQALRTRDPVPPALADGATVPGFATIRTWGDAFSDAFSQDLAQATADELRDASGAPGSRDEPASIIAISGGGPLGAFGAGLMKGWTETGTRPEFKIVTGVSTGALMAPFVFLGPAYDDQLRDVYTSIGSDDIFKTRSLTAMFVADSLALTDPLAVLINDVFDNAFIADIAAERARGRRLYVATTNLDAQRPVIWDMTAIAASKSPEAPGLFREILRASSSIPVAFEPVYITVEADGQFYDEMHVDGGVTHQVFLFGNMIDPIVRVRDADGPYERPLDVYVIRNTYGGPRHEQVDPRLIPISIRSIDTLLASNTLGDVFRIYLSSREHGSRFRVAAIPPSVELEFNALFDPEAMAKLFEFGYFGARTGEIWREHPIGFSHGDTGASPR